MVECNEKIDIVIPYYNDNDEIWKNKMYKYMSVEGSHDRQVTGEERYREWGCFKYFFRGVEKNCKWVNKVFLIVASESQIPEWIDRKNPKLRIVLHKDFIPIELLPTFNIFTIENYICRIKELADNYIYCNDDYYFLNPTTAGMFFVDGYPVYNDTETEIATFDDSGTDGTFYRVLNNGMELQETIDEKKARWYAFDHLPVSHKKNFENEILKEHFDKFIRANKRSKFRNKENISNHVFTCLYKDTKPYYKFNNYHNSCYVSINSNTNFNDYEKKDMVCFNDTESVTHDEFENIKKRMVDFLEKKLSDKSKYEK